MILCSNVSLTLTDTARLPGHTQIRAKSRLTKNGNKDAVAQVSITSTDCVSHRNRYFAGFILFSNLHHKLPWQDELSSKN